jgi:hypothetical protein
VTTDKSKSRPDRLSVVAEGSLRTDSLVGSFFHSTATPGWQGCVVAEPVPGRYLCELFSWLAGDSTQQVLVSIDEMRDWAFYDTAEWMQTAYDLSVRNKWDRERVEVEAPSQIE